MAEGKEASAKQGEILALLRTYDPPEKLIRDRDMLGGRYRILTNQPLPELSSPYARAYNAQDTQQQGTALYALVFENTAPIRHKNIAALLSFRHPHMVSLLEAGRAEIGLYSEMRYVALLEKPPGQPISRLLGRGRSPMPELAIIQSLLRPLTDVITALAALGISHNRIHPSNIYQHNNQLVLGECISAPSGATQEPLFEPIDRLLALPLARPDFSSSADCYALSVTALHMALGYWPFAGRSVDSLIREILEKGTYHALATQDDFSPTMHDLFRGLLNDLRREKRTPENLSSWVNGRRFNLVMPGSAREIARGFEFLGETHYNCETLAYSMWKNWPDGLALLSDTRLTRWLETAAHKGLVSEIITRLVGGGASLKSERSANDTLARALIALDPSAPIRLKNLSVSPEGLGTLFTYSILTAQQEDLQTLIQLIELDLPGFWLEQQKTPSDYHILMQRYQKLRTYLRMQSVGFGLERCLYDFNLDICCQSPLVKRYHVMELSELLIALDVIAAQQAAQHDFMDRHIAAFIASKLGIEREARIPELESIAPPSTQPQLAALRLLARAHSKVGKQMPVRGLCWWIAARIVPLMDRLHKRDMRAKTADRLKEVAGSGHVYEVEGLLLSPQTFAADEVIFRKTVQVYAQRRQLIANLKSPFYLSRRSRMAGRGIAQAIAFTICGASVYFTLHNYFHG